jgi:hypothetical protein
MKISKNTWAKYLEDNIFGIDYEKVRDNIIPASDELC